MFIRLQNYFVVVGEEIFDALQDMLNEPEKLIESLMKAAERETKILIEIKVKYKAIDDDLDQRAKEENSSEDERMELRREAISAATTQCRVAATAGRWDLHRLVWKYRSNQEV